MEPRILIAGTGRAGTSFLMRLLTRLGHDTGFTRSRDGYHPQIRAGCERIELGEIHDAGKWERLPRIVKSPYLSVSMHLVPVPIAHVICPVRDLLEVEESRSRTNLRWDKTPAEVLGRLVATCTLREIPLTLMRFPDSVTDPEYCRRKLSISLDAYMDRGEFNAAFDSLQPERANA